VPRSNLLILAAALAGPLAGLAAAVLPPAFAAEQTVLAPVPAVDAVPSRKLETAVFAGGCYWGVEGVFSHIKGVHLAVSGFAGGPRGRTVDYAQVSEGDTGYAESVRVTYDPQQVSYGQLLRVFFSVVADPTTLNYQGPDHGTQYRSALFPLDAAQDRAARAYLAQLGASKLWSAPIVTRVERFTGFQNAAPDHQDFLEKNPHHPYIMRWDAPKVAALKTMFPALYTPKASR
jgi:peptide-methionine (S)-S-oxide reductase